ncbi:MAG: hypothetical protein FWC68_02915 [Oscillospiraceae bacterium]|nr:hypothetical protein [Oscillospiraceae bacterium]
MNKIKYVIIGLAIILVVVVTAILIYYLQNENESVEDAYNEDLEVIYGETVGDFERVITNEVVPVENEAVIFTITECINTYLRYISMQSAEAVLSLLCTEFIERNAININNLHNFVEPTTTRMEFIPIQMNLLEGYRVNTYSVYGVITEAETGRFIRFAYFIVSTDEYDITFMIEPINIERYNNINEIELQRRHDSIEENTQNRFRGANPTDEDIAILYARIFIYTALYNIEFAYEMLDQGFRETRFQSLQEYEEFIANNSNELRNLRMASYSISEENGKVRVAVVDQHGRRFNFRETAIMQFTVTFE